MSRCEGGGLDRILAKNARNVGTDSGDDDDDDNDDGTDVNDDSVLTC